MKKRIADMEPGTVFKWNSSAGDNVYILTSRKRSDYGITYVEAFMCGTSHLIWLTGNIEADVIGRINERGELEEVKA